MWPAFGMLEKYKMRYFTCPFDLTEAGGRLAVLFAEDGNAWLSGCRKLLSDPQVTYSWSSTPNSAIFCRTRCSTRDLAWYTWLAFNPSRDATSLTVHSPNISIQKA